MVYTPVQTDCSVGSDTTIPTINAPTARVVPTVEHSSQALIAENATKRAKSPGQQALAWPTSKTTAIDLTDDDYDTPTAATESGRNGQTVSTVQ